MTVCRYLLRKAGGCSSLIRPYLFFVFIFAATFTSFGQGLSGRVLDSRNREPLAFANLIFNDKNQGVTTDIDGYFSIKSMKNVDFLKVSYLGYEQRIIPKEEFASKNYIEIKLKSNTLKLKEVTIIAGENPAHRIINEVIKNADKNNPEKMRSFSYTSYNKMYFTVDTSLLISEPKISSDSAIRRIDSSAQRAMDFFSSQYLFFSESVTERKFRYPDNNKETVLAQRISGLQNPNFIFLTSQLQSLSFYNEHVVIDRQYLSPLSKGSTKRYFFNIEDTLFNERADTIFVISYRPLKGKNFDGLKGVMQINSNGYAIQNINAEPVEKNKMMDVFIQQKYEFINDTQWFPVQLNTELTMRSAAVQTENTFVPILAIGKTYIDNIQLNPDIKRSEIKQIAVDIKNDANKKSEDFWNEYRIGELSAREEKTYNLLDSLSEKHNVERYFDAIEFFADGYIPWKFININPKHIYWYNQYEGSRLGLGLETNERLIPWLSVGGYFAYGFRDKAWKYGGHARFILHKPSNAFVELGYKNDVAYSDHIGEQSQRISLTAPLLDMFYKEMDPCISYYGAFNFSSLKYLRTKIEFKHSIKTIINKDRYNYLHSIEDEQQLNELSFSFRYAYKERFMQMPSGKRISMGTKYPVLTASITKSLNPAGDEKDYLKIEGSLSKKFSFSRIGESNITLNAGLIDGIAPYAGLYYMQGNNYWLSFNNTFNTMRVYEFVSDRFANIHFKHNLGILFNIKGFAPEFTITSSAGWGDAKLVAESPNPDHAKLMNKGYYESGLLMNGILKINSIGYGFGVYYRYGPYAFEETIDNFTFKLSFSLSL